MDDFVYQLAAPASFGRSSKTCFAARQSGLCRSDDGGQTWQLAYASLQLSAPLPTLAVAVHPQFEQTPWLCAGAAGGVFCSDDGGQTWHSGHFPQPPPVVTALAISPNFERDGCVFAATMDDGVLFSQNRGATWQAWNFGLLDPHVLCLGVSPHFADDATVFAGVQSGLFRSLNGGRSWREVALPVGYEAILCLAISPDGVVLAGTETQGLLISENNGDTWDQVGKGVLADPVNGIMLHPEFPARPEMALLHGGAVIHSANRGATWFPWRSGALGDAAVSAALAPLGFEANHPALIGLADGRILI